MRSLVRDHIEDAVTNEWPQMAQQGATLSVVPAPLADLQAMALDLRPETHRSSTRWMPGASASS